MGHLKSFSYEDPTPQGLRVQSSGQRFDMKPCKKDPKNGVLLRKLNLSYHNMSIQ